MRKYVLKSPIDLLTRAESLDFISRWVRKQQKMKLVVTAYSEFYVRAQSDLEFMEVLRSADLITPDGVSVLAAAKYLDRVEGKSIAERLWGGIKVGGEILTGKVGETVTGVWLFDELTKLAAKKGWKIFLLGGWDKVSERVTRMLLKRFPNIQVSFDEGEKRVGADEKKNKEVIEKINKFAPDILFVAYNPIKQEKWLAEHRKELKAKVGIGVGGTFNEYLGDLKKAPVWMEKAGLKWLFRVIREPKRLRRIWRAVMVFPWLVFREGRR